MRGRLRVTLVGASIMREAELPGFEDVTDFASECYNLAIASLKSAALQDDELREHTQIKILDFPVSWDRKELGAREAALVVETAPDVVGLSCYCWSLDTLLAAATRIREALPDVLLLLGGPSAGPVGGELLAERPEIDVVAAGEGEQTFTALLHALLDGASLSVVPGLIWRGPAGDVVENPLPEHPVDVTKLRSPYRAGVMHPSGSSLFIETSRGCRFRCRFCSWMGAGRELRYVPLEAVEWDLRWALDNGYTSIKLADTAINFHTDRVRDLMDTIRRVDPHQQMRFTYFLKLELLDEEQTRYLEGIPTEEIILGVESLNAPARRAVAKPPFDSEDFERKVELLQRVGPVTVSLIFGLPDDTIDGLLETCDWFVDFDRRHPDWLYLIYIFWLAVLPGASFHYEREKHRFRVMPEGTPYFLESRDFSPDDLLVMARRSVERHYAHPKLRVEYFHKEYLMQDAPRRDRHVVLPRVADDRRRLVTLAGTVDPSDEARLGVRSPCLETAELKTFVETDDDVRRGWRVELVDVPTEPGAPLSEEAIEAIAEETPELLVWYATGGELRRSSDALDALRARLPDSTIAVVGHGRELETALGAEALLGALPSVDLILAGEGERALQGVLRELLREEGDVSSVAGLVLREGDAVRSTPPAPPVADIDAVPSPYLWGFIQRPGETMTMRLTRPALPGAQLRVRGPARVYSEIRWLIEQRHSHVIWTDPALPADPVVLRAFVDAVREADPAGSVVHSYTLPSSPSMAPLLAILAELPTRTMRITTELSGRLAPREKAALRAALVANGGRAERIGPDPWLAPRRVAALLHPWTVGLAVGGWMLRDVQAADDGHSAILTMGWAEGGGATVIVTRPSVKPGAPPAPSPFAVAVHPGKDPAPSPALRRLSGLLRSALEAGSRRVRAKRR